MISFAILQVLDLIMKAILDGISSYTQTLLTRPGEYVMLVRTKENLQANVHSKTGCHSHSQQILPFSRPQEELLVKLSFFI